MRGFPKIPLHEMEVTGMNNESRLHGMRGCYLQMLKVGQLRKIGYSPSQLVVSNIPKNQSKQKHEMEVTGMSNK